MATNFEVDSIETITEWPVTSNCCQETSDRAAVSCHENQNETQPGNRYNKSDSYLKYKRRWKEREIPKQFLDDAQGNKLAKISKLWEQSIRLSAKAILAKWWKHNGFYLVSKKSIGERGNKLTSDGRIIAISKLPCTKAFIKQEVQKLLGVIRNRELCYDDRAATHSDIAWFYERLNRHDESLQHLNRALALMPDDKQIKWRIIKIQKQLNVIKIQEDHLKLLSTITPRAPLTSTRQVLRVPVDDISCEDFIVNYALTGTPLIITGLADRITRVPWTLQYIRDVAGSCQVTTKIPAQESVEWAKLEPSRTTTVAEFIDTIDSTQQYLFDWSLPIHCPQLAKDITIPRYFANDFLQRTCQGSLYRDSWPSLFIAPPGLTSELHIDSFASNFWMALFLGRKRWTFYEKADVALLYPEYYESMDPVFNADVCVLDLTRHPLLQMVAPYQCELQSGEILFVPSGCPHRVENLETSIAISANYVDETNIDAVKDELLVNGLIDPRAEELYKQFCHPNFPTTMDMNINDLPWLEFKTRQYKT